jgi:hypothetical protein
MSAADWKPSEDLEAAKEATRMMDELSHSGFSRINGLARLCLLSLENPEGYRSVEALAAALVTICEIAEDTKNLINSEAGDVGCGHQDEAWRRRADARRAHLEAQRKAGAAA